MQTFRPTLMLCAALVLGACGGGSSNDDVTADEPGPGTVFSDESGAGNEADPGAGDGSTAEPDTDAAGEGDGTGGDTDPGAGDGSTAEPDTDAVGEGDGAGGDVAVGADAEPDDDRIGTGIDAESDIVQPGIPGNLAATRLILGMERVLKATLLDLNTRYASGSTLSEQQQACLGSYDPALGEPAFALGCERALATGDVEVYVEQGALYRTADCAADLAAGTAERCVMKSARVVMRSRLVLPPVQEGRGRPLFVAGSGVVASYAIGAPQLTLENEERSLVLPFDCAFELQNGALLPSTGGRESCQGQVRDAADHIDFLSPVVF